MSEGEGIRVRLFGGLRGSKAARIEEESLAFADGLTVGKLWSELQRAASPHTLLASIERDLVLALVNGAPIQRLAGWDTPLAAGDTVTFMVRAFGG